MQDEVAQDGLEHELNRDLCARLMAEEGFRPLPYCDGCGLFFRRCHCAPEKRRRVTIGFGRNLEDVGISLGEARELLEHDVEKAIQQCRKQLPWFVELDARRQMVLADMAFNLGINGLLGFRKMLAAVFRGEFDAAAAEMLDSAWAKQVGSRATRLAEVMRSGELEGK